MIKKVAASILLALLVATIVLLFLGQAVLAASFFIFLGVFFVLVGSIGLLRFPDVYTRMHAMGIASTLGIGCIIVGSLIFFNWESHTFSIKELALLGGILLTFPVSTHLTIQAAYKTRVPLYKKRRIDELRWKDID